MDPDTPSNVTAIIPLDPLAQGTTYDVRVVGAIDGMALDPSWTFTTSAR